MNYASQQRHQESLDQYTLINNVNLSGLCSPRSNKEAMTFETGTRLLHYELAEKIGEGAWVWYPH